MKLSQFFFTLFFTIICSDLSADQWKTYTTENSGLGDNEVRAICVDGSGVKWFGTTNGLTSFDGTNWKNYTTDDNLAQNTVNAIEFEITSYGPEIWVATNGGVSVVSVKPDAITFATPYRKDNTGLISDMVYTAAVDTGHVKWFGTDSGVSSFSGSTWTSYTTENILDNNCVLSIAAADDGWLYFGTNGTGVSRYDGVTSASPIDTQWSGIASDKVYAIYIHTDDARWFGTDKGVSRHTGDETKENWATYSVDDGLAGNFIHAITGDEKGVIWVGSDGGVSSFDGSVWKKFTKENGLAGNNVYAIAVDTNGSLWFGTEAGISKYSDDSILVEETENIPTAIAIRGCFPNPFNPQTTIEYILPSAGFVELSVYNLAGQKVRQLVYNTKIAGNHTAIWDGCDESGVKVSSGIYITKLRMGNQITSSRMVLVK